MSETLAQNGLSGGGGTEIEPTSEGREQEIKDLKQQLSANEDRIARLEEALLTAGENKPEAEDNAPTLAWKAGRATARAIETGKGIKEAAGEKFTDVRGRVSSSVTEKVTGIKEKVSSSVEETITSAREKASSVYRKVFGMQRETEISPEAEHLSGADKLAVAREQLARLRIREKSFWKRRPDEAEIEEAEEKYRDAFNRFVSEEVREARERGEIKDGEEKLQILSIVMDEIKARADNEASFRAESKAGKFINWYRSKSGRAIKTAVGIALATIGVVSTATGAVPIGVAALGLRAMLAGGGAYMAAKGGLEYFDARRDEKSEAEILDAQKQLTDNELYQQILASVASEAPKEVSEVEDGEEVSDDVMDRLNYILEKIGRGHNVRAADAMSEILDMQLDKEREDTQRGRTRNIRNTLIAAGAGVLVSGATLAIGIGRLTSALEHARNMPSAGTVGTTVTGEYVPASPNISTGAIQQTVEISTPPTGAFEHTVTSGEGLWHVSRDALKNRVPNWGGYSSSEQTNIINSLKNKLLEDRYASGNNWVLYRGENISVPTSYIAEVTS
jgi:hypothetical protein